MAHLEESIFSVLTGDTTVAALVGTKVFPIVIPQKTALPAVTYQRISGPQEMSLDGHSGLESVRMQVDAYSARYLEAKALRSAIMAAMLSATAFTVGGVTDRDDFEDETGVYRVILEFSIKHRTA